MKQTIIPILIVLTFAGGAFANTGGAQHLSPKELDSFIESTMKAWKVPGLAVAIVEGDGIVFLKTYGVRQVGRPLVVDEHTLFAIGSTTKAMTAAAVGLLVDEKKLDWDDPVTKYLPWFQLPDPWVTREVTIRDLLCHRVGTNALLPAVVGFDRNEVLQRFRYLKPYLPFRYQYEYNNSMYTVAGQVVAAVSGLTWEEFVKTRLFNPLGMTETHMTVNSLWNSADLAPCFCCDLPGRSVGLESARNGANVAMPHWPVEGGMRVIPWRRYSTIGPAGGELSANIVDMSKWLKLQVGKGAYKGKRLLSKAVFKQMHTPQIVIPLENAPLFLKDEPDVHFLAYGFGWRLNDYRGRLMSWHTGGVYGFLTLVGLLPELNVGVVILTNAEGTGAAGAVLMHVFDGFLGAPQKDWCTLIMARKQASEAKVREEENEIEQARIEGTRPSLPLEAYTGIYFDSAYGNVNVTEEKGSLVLSFPGGATGDLKHWHYDLFRLYLRAPVPLPSFVTFSLDSAGRVRGMSVEGVAEFKKALDSHSN
jgi:CubicO group peptidase (beta-lactamase class C family)